MNEEEKKKLFIALVAEEKLEAILEHIVAGEEYIMQKDGGEPDLVHLLCMRLLEELRGEKVRYSLVYNEKWRKHVLEKA